MRNALQAVFSAIWAKIDKLAAKHSIKVVIFAVIYFSCHMIIALIKRG